MSYAAMSILSESFQHKTQDTFSFFFQHLSLFLVMLPMSSSTTDADIPASVGVNASWWVWMSINTESFQKSPHTNENFIRNVNVQNHTICIDKKHIYTKLFFENRENLLENRRRTNLLYNAGHSSSGRINMLFHVNLSNLIGLAEHSLTTIKYEDVDVIPMHCKMVQKPLQSHW